MRCERDAVETLKAYVETAKLATQTNPTGAQFR
jgi:hypothetical protein